MTSSRFTLILSIVALVVALSNLMVVRRTLPPANKQPDTAPVDKHFKRYVDSEVGAVCYVYQASWLSELQLDCVEAGHGR
jgi:hypothetical protein